MLVFAIWRISGPIAPLAPYDVSQVLDQVSYFYFLCLFVGVERLIDDALADGVRVRSKPVEISIHSNARLPNYLGSHVAANKRRAWFWFYGSDVSMFLKL